jgi:hypothetical protein
LVVQWAGQEGCPLVQVDAVRSGPKVDWMSLTRCRDVPDTLPAAITAFHPDAVLLVLGAMELMQQHYPSDPADSVGHLPGDAVYVQHHDAVMQRLTSVIDAHHVPLLMADTPPLGVGRFSSFDMADPARAAAFNALVVRWDAQYPAVREFAYADAIVSYETAHGGIRGDGSHPELQPLTVIAHDTLVPRLLLAIGL